MSLSESYSASSSKAPPILSYIFSLKIANQFIVVERRVQELEEDDGRQSVVSSAEALRQRHRRHDADIDISDEEAIDLDLYPRVAERLAPGDE